MALLPDGLLELMRCPACHGELAEREEESLLVCASCGVRYPVRDRIPIMLAEEALPPEE